MMRSHMKCIVALAVSCAPLLAQAGIGRDYGRSMTISQQGIAATSQILASQAVRDELPDWAATVQDALTLKGFDAPVTAYELHGNGDR